jgi:hypothetical protein
LQTLNHYRRQFQPAISNDTFPEVVNVTIVNRECLQILERRRISKTAYLKNGLIALTSHVFAEGLKKHFRRRPETQHAAEGNLSPLMRLQYFDYGLALIQIHEVTVAEGSFIAKDSLEFRKGLLGRAVVNAGPKYSQAGSKN